MNFLYQIFSEDLIYALGWTVLHSLWQALAIGLMMAVGMLFLQQKSAKVRYEVAAFSLFLVFVSALVTFLVYYETAQTASNFSPITFSATTNGTGMGAGAVLATTTLESFMEYFNQHLPLVVMVWLLGVCFFLLRLMGGLAYIQRIKYTNNKPAPKFWRNRLQKLCKKVRLRRSVKLVESSLATVPMVIGYFKPIILMPIGAINGLSESEVDAIFAHELAHVYRNDFLINIFLSVIELLFYFNPAVWWIAANVRTERENCCDDIAICLCGSSLVYAKALLSLQNMSHAAPGYAMAFAGPKNQLLQRIKRILSQPRTKSNMLEKFMATCLLLVTVVLFSIGANSHSYNQKLQQQVFADELNQLMTEENEDAPDVYAEWTAADDTTPKNKKQRYIKKSNEGEVEMEIEEGDITRLMIDGEEIPSDELADYDELINDLIEEMEAVPRCTTPTSPHQHSRTSTIAASPTFAPKLKKTITTETEDNGQTRIMIRGSGEPTEIIFNDGHNLIFIDGTRLEGGDTAVIIDEQNSFSFQGNGNRFALAPSDFSFELDDFTFDFDIASLNGLSEEDKDALRKSAASFEEVMALSKKEMKQMFDELKHQKEVLNHQLRELHHQKADEHSVQRERQDKQDARRFKKEVIKEKREYKENNDREEKRSYERIERKDRQDQSAIRFDDPIKNAIGKELKKDGLINNENNYSFELTNVYFKVNGKKQSTSTAKKYLRLYENKSGHKMNCNARIQFHNRNGEYKTSYRSTSEPCHRFDQQYTYYFFRGQENCSTKVAKLKQIEGLETLRIQLAPVKINFDLLRTT